MIYLLPFSLFAIRLDADLTHVVGALSEVVAPRPRLTRWGIVRRADRQHKLYGAVSRRRLYISKATRCRNALLPFLFGILVPGQGKTILFCVLTIHPLVMAFVLFSISGALAAKLGLQWVAAFMILGTALFNIEAYRLRSVLNAVFRASRIGYEYR